jgi:hypothetical protein
MSKTAQPPAQPMVEFDATEAQSVGIRLFNYGVLSPEAFAFKEGARWMHQQMAGEIERLKADLESLRSYHMEVFASEQRSDEAASRLGQENERLRKLIAIADDLIGVDEVNLPRAQWEEAKAALAGEGEK